MMISPDICLAKQELTFCWTCLRAEEMLSVSNPPVCF